MFMIAFFLLLNLTIPRKSLNIELPSVRASTSVEMNQCLKSPILLQPIHGLFSHSLLYALP